LNVIFIITPEISICLIFNNNYTKDNPKNAFAQINKKSSEKTQDFQAACEWCMVNGYVKVAMRQMTNLILEQIPRNTKEKSFWLSFLYPKSQYCYKMKPLSQFNH